MLDFPSANFALRKFKWQHHCLPVPITARRLHICAEHAVCAYPQRSPKMVGSSLYTRPLMEFVRVSTASTWPLYSAFVMGGHSAGRAS